MLLAGRLNFPDLAIIKIPLPHPGYCRYPQKNYLQIITYGFAYRVKPLVPKKNFHLIKSARQAIAYQTLLEHRRQKEKCQRQDAVHCQQH